MMNKHKLSRTIPEPVKRQVRQRCGFGCVVCGSAIYDYEHFNPEFKDAKEHNPDGIALLCPTDHARKRKKLLSKQQYLKSITNPKALENKKAYTEWEIASFAPIITLGQKIFTGGTSILKIDDELILGFKQPEEVGSPPRLNLRFFDRKENEVLSIVDNEIQLFTNSFDIETTSNNWIVRSKLYNVDLHIQLNPPNTIVVKKLHFYYKKWELFVKNEYFKLSYDGKQSMAMTGAVLIHGPCLFRLTGEGNVEMKDMTLQGLGGEKSGKPKMIKFPIFLYVDAENDTPIKDVELCVIKNNNILPIFTSEILANKFASSVIPSKYKLKSLGLKGFLQILKHVALPKGITKGVLDTPLYGDYHVFTTVDFPRFIEDNNKKIDRNASCPCGSGKRYKHCHGKL